MTLSYWHHYTIVGLILPFLSLLLVFNYLLIIVLLKIIFSLSLEETSIYFSCGHLLPRKEYFFCLEHFSSSCMRGRLVSSPLTVLSQNFFVEVARGQNVSRMGCQIALLEVSFAQQAPCLHLIVYWGHIGLKLLCPKTSCPLTTSSSTAAQKPSSVSCFSVVLSDPNVAIGTVRFCSEGLLNVTEMQCLLISQIKYRVVSIAAQDILFFSCPSMPQWWSEYTL